MSLSDTAEYWWDIKNKRPYSGKDFKHHPTYKCSHINSLTNNTCLTPYIEDINCYECKEFIEKNGVEGLKEGKASIDFYMTKAAGKKWRKQKKEQLEIEQKYGKCSCGSRWQIRTNRKTNQEFLGCLQYPACTNSKPI